MHFSVRAIVKNFFLLGKLGAVGRHTKRHLKKRPTYIYRGDGDTAMGSGQQEVECQLSSVSPSPKSFLSVCPLFRVCSSVGVQRFGPSLVALGRCLQSLSPDVSQCCTVWVFLKFKQGPFAA